MAWRYIASRLNGNGTETFLDWNLPLSQVKVKEVLSGPSSLSAVIAPEVTRLIHDGRPVLERWSTAIYPELDGDLIGLGFILSDFSVENDQLNIEAVGFAGYPQGMAFVGDKAWSSVDCADVARYVWSHLQAQPMGNIGMVLPDTFDTGITLGVPAVPAYIEVQIGGKWIKKTSVSSSQILPEVSGVLSANMTATQTTIPLKAIGKFASLPRPFEVTIQGERMTVAGVSGNTLTGVTRGVNTTKKTHGKGAYVKHSATPQRTVQAVAAAPYRLSEYETHDLGKVFDDMAVAGGFDYHEVHSWDGETIRHELRMAKLVGRRKPELRFAVGENIAVAPKIEFDGDEYASEVIVLGAGEGSKMVRARAGRADQRIRRTAVVTDKTLTTTAKAQTAATRELNYRLGTEDVTEIVVIEHPNAPIGSFEVGDEIPVLVGAGWSEQTALWVRVLAITYSPENAAVASLSVARVDRISA